MMIAALGTRECCAQHLLKVVETPSRAFTFHSICVYMGYMGINKTFKRYLFYNFTHKHSNNCLFGELIHSTPDETGFSCNLIGSLHLWIIAFLHRLGNGLGVLFVCFLTPKFIRVQQDLMGHSPALDPLPCLCKAFTLAVNFSKVR